MAILFITIKYVIDIINLLKNNKNTITESYEPKTKSKYVDNNSSSTVYYDDTDSDINFSEESFYCERCFKKISEEEYESNDCM